MKIIIPMAGRGSRLRPHTLTTPKPLVKIVGKPIVERLVEDIAEVCPEPIDEIAFIIGDFGKEVEEQLHKIAEKVGAKSSIYQQDQPLGTAHAILCAAPSMDGKIVVAFADTLFRAEFTLDAAKDAIIWTKRVPNPEAFGVVTTDADGRVNAFVEKPKEFVTDQAIIGIYYFQKGEDLRAELQYLIDNKVIVNGEYQLTDALENLKNKETNFYTTNVDEWLDCGNKKVTVETNQRYMDFLKPEELVSEKATVRDSVIIPPVFIAEGAVISHSVIGPHVSIGKNTKISASIIKNSIIQEDTNIEDAQFSDSMVGNKVNYSGRSKDLSIGDFTTINE